MSDEGPASRGDPLVDVGTPVADHVRYVAIGDSIARGFLPTWPRPWRRDRCDFRLTGIPLRWFDDPSIAYPVTAARMISDAVGAPVALDMERTCSGMRTDHLWRNDSPTELLRSGFDNPVDLVTITVGANDLMPLWFRHLAAVTILRPVQPLLPTALTRSVRERCAPQRRRILVAASGVEHRLDRILAWIGDQSPSARVLVTSYCSGDDSQFPHTEFSLPLFGAICAAVGRHTSASMIDVTPLLTVPGANRTLTSRWDGLHPTADGQRAIARAVADEAVRLMAVTHG